MDSQRKVMVNGHEAASLYQTFGVPPELLQALAAEKSFTFDWDGYREAMAEHEKISGDDQKELFKTGPIETLKEAIHRSEFLGYETAASDAKVKGIIVGPPKADSLVSSLQASASEEQLVRLVLGSHTLSMVKAVVRWVIRQDYRRSFCLRSHRYAAFG